MKQLSRHNLAKEIILGRYNGVFTEEGAQYQLERRGDYFKIEEFCLFKSLISRCEFRDDRFKAPEISQQSLEL